MRLISVCGVSKSGKTTTVEVIISGLKKRGYSVGSIKDIHFEDFAMDSEGTNTFRHHAAGAEPVCALGRKETDLLYHTRLPLEEILAHYDNDFVILEGTYEINIPKIVTGHTKEDVEEKIDDRTVLISGRAAALYENGFGDIPAIDPLREPDRLVDFVIARALRPLPGFSCACGLCGSDCEEMTRRIIKGTAKREDCKNTGGVILKIGNRNIEMVPYVKATLAKVLRSFVSELKGYKEGERIEITIE